MQCKNCKYRIPNTIENSGSHVQYDGHEFMSLCTTHDKHVLPVDKACDEHGSD